jgi:hypothetical protein
VPKGTAFLFVVDFQFSIRNSQFTIPKPLDSSTDRQPAE